MTRRAKQRVDDIDQMIRALQSLRRALPEVERRNRLAAGSDGYSVGTGSSGGSGGSTVANPTERAALGRRLADPVRDWSREMLFQLETASKAIDVADSRRRLIFDGDGPPALCEVCRNPSDELKTGRCPADYQYRRRNGVDRAC